MTFLTAYTLAASGSLLLGSAVKGARLHSCLRRRRAAALALTRAQGRN